MRNKQNALISYGYHFISEAILLFLIAIPFMNNRYGWVPYWSYFVLVLIICAIFSLYTKLTTSFSWYILSTPVIALVLYYPLGYPLLLSTIFPVVLTWRYINIRQEKILNRESVYISIAFVLSLFLVFLVKDYQIIFYLIFLFLNLIIGYIMSHLAVIKKEQRKQINGKLWVFIIGIVSLGTMASFLLFDTIRNLFLGVLQGFSYVLIFIIGKIGELLQHINFSFINKQTDQGETEMGEQGYEQLEEMGPSLAERLVPYINWGMIILIIAVILIITIRAFRKKFKKMDSATEGNAAISYHRLDGDSGKEQHFMRQMFRNYFNKPDHPARKIIYQLERKLAKTDYHRYSSETIEEWAKRIGFTSDLKTYQKVRYGEQNVSDQEMKELKSQIKALEEKLEL